MCEYCATTTLTKTTMAPAPLARRSVLKLGVGAVAFAGLALPRQKAFAKEAKAPPKPQNVLTPEAALERLMRGNARYVEGVTRRHDFAHEREVLSGGQNPFAGVLSCADSRIGPEYCFDVARGDVFVCRVAGNFANDDNVASFEYAVSVLNAPLIVVLGHDACGAVDATIKSVKSGSTLPGHLPALVTAIAPAVTAAQGESGDLLVNAIRQNVLLNVNKLKTATPILSKAVDDNKLRVVGAIYRLASGKVEALSQ